MPYDKVKRRAHYLANRERDLAWQAAYDASHKEELKAYRVKHYLKNLWKNISQHTVNGKFAESGRKNPTFVSYFRNCIRIHPEWRLDRDAFVKWIRDNIGERPKGLDGEWLSLDRIDNSGNYEPGNLRWANALTQATNKGSTGRMVEIGYIEGYYDG